jgi:hypothetical protein
VRGLIAIYHHLEMEGERGGDGWRGGAPVDAAKQRKEGRREEREAPTGAAGMSVSVRKRKRRKRRRAAAREE